MRRVDEVKDKRIRNVKEVRIVDKKRLRFVFHNGEEMVVKAVAEDFGYDEGLYIEEDTE